ncbi:unnamed protein product [Linum tenue]|uniref:HMA domain-containing protein n=1 Tax=Linum tenue TaxID=586396 RepID=A0AAV0GQ14_9ROSI|nr:unnamed protein product [Linum tenue]
MNSTYLSSLKSSAIHLFADFYRIELHFQLPHLSLVPISSIPTPFSPAGSHGRRTEGLTTMVIKVDLDCYKCRNKIKKVLCRIPRDWESSVRPKSQLGDHHGAVLQPGESDGEDLLQRRRIGEGNRDRQTPAAEAEGGAEEARRAAEAEGDLSRYGETKRAAEASRNRQGGDVVTSFSDVLLPPGVLRRARRRAAAAVLRHAGASVLRRVRTAGVRQLGRRVQGRVLRQQRGVL